MRACCSGHRSRVTGPGCVSTCRRSARLDEAGRLNVGSPGRQGYDVVVVGGGPAGAVTAWALAKRGVRVAVLERARFPREKVCGDFIEPRGLRLLEAIGCLEALEASSPLPITHVAMFLQSQCAYRGRIPFYGGTAALPPHRYHVARAA